MANSRRFSGTATVYGNPVFVDTSDGTGFVEVLDRMASFLDSFAKWGSSDPSQEESDIRQDARLAAVEGIMAYDPDKKAQLSTFLHTYVRRRMIDARRKRRVPQVSGTPEAAVAKGLEPEDRLFLVRVAESWDPRWRRIMFRVFVLQDRIRDVARAERMSPWGLTRAIRRKIREARLL